MSDGHLQCFAGPLKIIGRSRFAVSNTDQSGGFMYAHAPCLAPAP